MLEVLLDRMKRRKGVARHLLLQPAARQTQLALPLLRRRPSPAQRRLLRRRPRRFGLAAQGRERIRWSSSSSPAAARRCSICRSIRRSRLEDTIAFHQLLLASGAPINEINTLRKHFSAVKGGRLAMAAPEAAKISCCCPTCRCARWMRFLPVPLRPTTPPWPTCVRSSPSTIWRRSFRTPMRAFFEREDMPESPGNKSWRPPFLPKIPWADSSAGPRA